MNGIIYIKSSNYSEAIVENKFDQIYINGYENIGNIFHGDYVNITNNKCNLIKSNISSKVLIGVLELYSKYKFKPNKRGVDTYNFVSLEKCYPNFLVSTTTKKKYSKNIIVTIKFLSWENTLPFGEIITILGEIDNNDALYDGILYKYQLTKKYLKLDKNFINNLHDNYNIDQYNDITSYEVISIDPIGCKDIDDAMSFKELDNNKIQLNIHITDVIGTLIYHNLHLLFLNDDLTTSIYAPHKILNMFPEFLSCGLLSLLPGKKRLVLTLSLIIQNNLIISSSIIKNIIINKYAFSYEDFEKKHFYNCKSKYYKIINIVKNLQYKNLYNKFYKHFDSHKFIEKLMIIFNCESCKFILDNNDNPVLRIHEKNLENENFKNIDTELANFLQIINNKAAKYTISNDQNYHYALDLSNYCHFTSPIRRYVDIYNHYLVHKILDKKFINFNLSINLEKINDTNKKIKKAEQCFSYIKLSQIITNQNKNDFVGYIYNYNDISKKISLYLPTYNLTLDKKIIQKKLIDRYEINQNNNYLEILEKNTEKLIKYPLYELLNLKIYKIINNKIPYDKLILEIVSCHRMI